MKNIKKNKKKGNEKKKEEEEECCDQVSMPDGKGVSFKGAVQLASGDVIHCDDAINGATGNVTVVWTLKES